MENLKNGTKIIRKDYEDVFVFEKDTFWDKYDTEMCIRQLNCNEIEILSEEDEEIEIQSIEEINFISGDDENAYDNANKINELIQAIKHLDKKIKEKEND